jgi:glyoxylase-like metal-dependent hydrolase (beta-lactamase superfamily II)
MDTLPSRNKVTRFLISGLLIPVFIALTFSVCSKESSPVEEEQRSELIQPSKWWEKLPRPIYEKLEMISIAQDWFEIYKLTEDTYAIYEPYHFEEAIGYVALGEQRAVLIDTGTGIGDLKKAVQELTLLPVFVLNTHTHWDHIGNNFQFSEILCFNHPECIDKLLKGVGNKRLRESLGGDSLWKPLPQGFEPGKWTIPSLEPTALLEDGDIVELGNRSLEVIWTPGHSPGSICLLDKKNRILFTGDTFFPGPLYAYSEDVDLQDYIASIDRLAGRSDEFDYLCSGHNDPWVKSEVIRLVAEAFRTILDGKGDFKEDGGIRRYYFDGFDILISETMLSNSGGTNGS